MSQIKSQAGFNGFRITIAVALFICACVTPSAAMARGSMGGGGLGGDNQFSIIAGVSNSNQDQINTLISRSNARTTSGPISTPALNSAYELGVQYGYRFTGTMYAVLLRPTYFYEKATGSGKDGSYNYGISGFTIIPMLRLYPLENEFMKFFLQLGVGYGRANTSIEEGSARLDAVGDAFGTTLGLGAEFCMTASQCLSLEANLRYMTVVRNIASEASGTWASDSLSQAQTNKEVELDSDDLMVRMGGLQFLAGYVIHF
jgi:opacity protein-like surface antigen